MTESKKLLFFSFYSIPPIWLFHNQVDATVATALMRRGGDVQVIGCDGVFKDCYILRGAGNRKKETCEFCSQTSKTYFQDFFHIPYRQLSNFVADDDYDIAEQWADTLNPEHYPDASYQNIPIGKWVNSSIYTYFRISARGLSRPDVRKAHRLYLIDGLVTYKAVCRILDFYQPSLVFMFSGRLAPYRIAFEAARQRQIDVIVQERGYVDNSYTVVENHTCVNTKPALDFVNQWETVPLSNSELLQVKQYWAEREAGRNLNLDGFYNYQTDYIDVRRQLNIPKDARIVAVFTSSEDELAMAEDYAGITEQLDIIQRLIEVFADRDEYLIIRHHPYIAGASYVSAETDFIRRAYQQALSTPPNVRIVMPSEQLTSYALLWHTDAAITFFSTMAIEAAARGVPTAATKLSIYRNAIRHVIDKFDKESLRTLVDDLLSESTQPTIEDFRKLYRFTHAYFFKFCNKFRSFGSNGLNFDDEAELDPGIDPILDRVCDRILKGSPLYDLPKSESYHRSLLEETYFLEQELREVKEYRQRVREHTLKQEFSSTHPSVGIIPLIYQIEDNAHNLSLEWAKRSRYRNLKIYPSLNLDFSDFLGNIDSILSKLKAIPEDYILLANSYFQYSESFISSAMEVLLADTQKQIQGVLFGGWLPVSKNRVKRGVFPSQVIFAQRNLSATYEQAIEAFPALQYPPTALTFSVVRKESLLKILNQSKQMATASEAAENLFNFLQGADIHKIERPLLLIHEIPESIQQLLQNEQLIVLKDSLNLREINLIIFPDWQQPEELLLLQLEKVVQAVLTHPNKGCITLLIDISDISLEEAHLALSSVMMNLLLQENLDVSEEPVISFVEQLSDIGWEALLSCIQARIVLDKEDREALVHANAERIPQWNISNLIEKRVIEQERDGVFLVQ